MPGDPTPQVPLYHALQQVEQHRRTAQQAASDDAIDALPERIVQPGERAHKCEICLEDMTEGAEARSRGAARPQALRTAKHGPRLLVQSESLYVAPRTF